MFFYIDTQFTTDKMINGVKTSLLFLCQTFFFWGQLDRIDQLPNAIMERISENVRVKITCVEVILEGMDRIFHKFVPFFGVFYIIAANPQNKRSF